MTDHAGLAAALATRATLRAVNKRHHKLPIKTGFHTVFIPYTALADLVSEDSERVTPIVQQGNMVVNARALQTLEAGLPEMK